MNLLPKNYAAKVNRFEDVFKGRVPDRVPALSMAQTWVFHYSNISLKQAAFDMYENDGQLFFQAYKNFFNKIECDAILSILTPQWSGIAGRLGRGIYELTDESMTANNLGELLYEEEYDQFIGDPFGFIANTVLPRKYPVLNDDAEGAEALKGFYAGFNRFSANSDRFLERMKLELEVPLIRSGRCPLAPDIMTDFLRTVYGTSTDIKRNPENFLRACDRLQQELFELAAGSRPSVGRGMSATLHSGPLFNPQDFHDFYLPYLKLHSHTLTNLGHNVVYFLEGNWEPYVEFFSELPDKGIMCIFEYGDLKKIQKKTKGSIVIGGGMPLELLSLGKKQECLDYAKRLIDELAADGRYVFATDKSLISIDDVNASNYFSVYSFITEYGRY